MCVQRVPLRRLTRFIPALALLLSACGGYGGGSMSAAPAPTINFTVQPSTIVAGQSATLTWTAGSATTCTASGAWSGNQPTSGTATVTPTVAGTDTYTLTCTNAGSAYSSPTSSMASATLTVTAASVFAAKNLVADAASGTVTVDTNLVNPWGITFKPGAAGWIANNNSSTATLHDGNGVAQPAATPLTVQLPSTAGGAPFAPTGIVGNTTTDFVVTLGANSAAAAFLFTGEGGMIAGWSPHVDPTHAVAMFTDAGGAVYKGLTLANNGSGNFLYATDFHNNKVDVFNASFTRQTPSATSFTFQDPNLPAGFAPFGIQALKTGAGGAVQIYVTYAKQQAPANIVHTDGAGLGIVDIYDANGKFVKTLVAAGGVLNAPWGLALAPADFGTLSNALLVGNFGDGKINAFDPNSGASMGALGTAGGPFALPGLWGIAFGNDAVSQPHNTLFFAAGTNGEVNGSYGRIDLSP